MANEFYEAPDDNIPLTTVRSADENSDRASVELGFDKLPTEADMKRDLYGSDVSTVATLYQVTVPYLSGAYVEGTSITFGAQFSNTGVASMQVNGGAIVEFVDLFGNELIEATITAGQFLTAIYSADGQWRLVNATTDTGAATAVALQAVIDAQAAQAAAEAAQAAAEAAAAVAGSYQTIIPQTGGGELTAQRINEIRDGGTYSVPLANSVPLDAWIVIELPDAYESSIPTVIASGADTFIIGEGSDDTIIFNSGSTIMRLTSDGTANWRM